MRPAEINNPSTEIGCNWETPESDASITATRNNTTVDRLRVDVKEGDTGSWHTIYNQGYPESGVVNLDYNLEGSPATVQVAAINYLPDGTFIAALDSTGEVCQPTVATAVDLDTFSVQQNTETDFWGKIFMVGALSTTAAIAFLRKISSQRA